MKPSNEFTIRILDDDEFNKLPYPRADEALGMSVMSTKTAYIRKTGVKDLDQHTIEHEFDELMQTVSPHEENGIRYKLPIIGPLLTLLAKAAPAAAGLGAGVSGPATLGSAALAGAKAIGATALGAAGAYNTGKSVYNTVTGANRAQPTVNLPGYSQQQQTPQVSPVTQAFAPKEGPLSEIDFNKGLENLSANRANQRKSVFEKFRGLGPKESNTAFSGALTNVDTSADRARKQFLEDQRNLGSTFA